MLLVWEVMVNSVCLKQCVSNYCGSSRQPNTSLQWKTFAHEFYLHSCTVRQVFCLFTLYSVYFLVWKLLCLCWDVFQCLQGGFLKIVFPSILILQLWSCAWQHQHFGFCECSYKIIISTKFILNCPWSIDFIWQITQL